ncbi:MAG: hypothetical protein LLG13_07275 [Bacteroidales bacterium]|nr:hypothetical protein [Bacteroidales bacterium]
MQGFKDLGVEYLAGFVSEMYTYAKFLRVDVYRLESDGSKTFMVSKPVQTTIPNSYNDEYMSYTGEIKQIKYAEPYPVQDEITQDYYLSYDKTLKEAIGYAQGVWPSNEVGEYNIPILNKCFFSMPIDNQNTGSHIQLDLDPIFPNMAYGNEYMLLFDGVFTYEEQLNEIHLERPVTIYYQSPLSWKTSEITTAIPSITNWYKGDGHLHSNYSDGHSWIYNYCCKPDPDPPYGCKPTGSGEDPNFVYPRKHAVMGYCFNQQGQWVECPRPVLEKYTIAYQAKNRGKMDWIIMTDHANNLFDPKQPQGEQLSDGKVYPCANVDVGIHTGDREWFENYRYECRTAEKYLGIAVIPMEEVAVNKNCRESPSDCTKQNSGSGGHMLNYNLLNGPPENYTKQYGRIADNVWGGTELVREEIDNMCGCENAKKYRLCNQPPGTYGWTVIAHPNSSFYKWRCFKNDPYNSKVDWVMNGFGLFVSPQKHQCPSVARSYLDSISSNNGKGVFGIELADNLAGLLFRNTLSWDQYLFADTQQGIIEEGKFNLDHDSPTMNYNPHVYPDYDPNSGGTSSISTGNNFVVGMINSDDHNCYWQYQEDITAMQCNKNYIPIESYTLRKIPGYDDGTYIKAKKGYIPFISASTFVYSGENPANQSNPGSNQRKFLKYMRSCGKDNKGVSASLGGGWGTFAVRKTNSTTWINSGGRIEIDKHLENGEEKLDNLAIRVSALSPYLSNTNYTVNPIKQIRVYTCNGVIGAPGWFGKLPGLVDWSNFDENSDYAPLEVCRKDFTIEDKRTIMNEEEFIDLVVPNHKLCHYDYVRVEIEFYKTSNLDLVEKKIVYCNPVLVKNLANHEGD